MSRDKRAKALSQHAGVPYLTALRLLEGDYSLVPQTSECLIVAAFCAIGQPMQTTPNTRRCRCAKCSPPRPS